MPNKLTFLIAATLMATASLTAQAAHGGAGGMSAQHMSPPGLANTNGPAAADRDHGLARAEDRRNAEASAHEQANSGQSKGKHRHHTGRGSAPSR